MLSLVLAALLSVAVGHPVTPNCAIEPALLYSGQVLPVPLVYLSGTATGATTGYVAAPQQPVQPTPAVAQATAEFMAAWNEAAARVPKIQTTLVKSAPTNPISSFGVHAQAQQTEDVRKATAEFMAAWNAAAQRASAVEVGVTYGPPQPVQPTSEVQRATAEFMNAWHAAAQRAATVHAALSTPTTYSTGVPRQVEDTDEVKKATEEFMEAWQEAAARVPKIQTTMYHVSGIHASGTPSATATAPHGGLPQPVKFTPEVERATAEFMAAFNKAAALAAAAPDNDVSTLPTVTYTAPVASQTYTGPMASGIIVASGYTKEVDEARRAFQRAFDSAAARASVASTKTASVSSAASPAPTVPSQPTTGAQASAVIVASGYTQDVDQARRDFQKAYDAAAALAAAAPDTATYTGEKASGVILASGYTNEVEQARKDFQKAFEDAAARKTSTPDAQTYTGPFASAEITDSGFTKEVEAARKEFLATFEKVAARSPASPEAHTPYKAPQATPSAPASHKGPQYTGPLASGTIAPSGFTIEVDEARKQFMKAYDAAAALAAKTPDYSAVTYAASAHTHVQGGAPQPVEPTPEVARATAEFMAAWNAAATRVATIESTLVKSTPAAQVSISLPTHEEALETLRQANEEFMAAWNAAAQRVSSVQQAVTTYGPPKPVQPTEDVKQATAEFMAAWQAAARRAPKIEQAVVKAASYSSGAPQQVQATKEVQKATAEFMAAWNAAAARVPKIETAMYSAAQPAATSVGGTKQFLTLFTSAEQNAVQPSGSLALVPIGVDVAFANTVGTSIAYAGTTASSPETVVTLKTFPLSNRLFAPIQGLPVFYNCKCDLSSTLVLSAHNLNKYEIRFIGIQDMRPDIYKMKWISSIRQRKIKSRVFTRCHTDGNKSNLQHLCINSCVQKIIKVFVRYPEEERVWQRRPMDRVHQPITALAALFSVAVGHPVTPNCAIEPALLYSGQVLPVPLVYLSGTAAGSITEHVAAPQQPVQPTPAVAQATAEFMAAWNEAAARVPKIQTTLVKSAPTNPISSFGVHAQAQQTEDVRKATAEFMAAWNAAAQRASAVEVGVTYGPPQPVQPTSEVQRATAEFMKAWHAAAQRAATVHAALSTPTTYSTGVPRQVEDTDEVKKATEEFMEAWQEAAARVPKIQTTMYHVSGIHATGTPTATATAPHGGLPQPVKFTPEVERATAEFMAAFNKAAALAAAAPDNDVSTLPTVTYTAPVASQTYTGPMASGIIVASGYTKEVDEARHAFQRAFDSASARASVASTKTASVSSAASPAPTVPSQPSTGAQASAVIVASGYTQEVDQARRDFQKAYDAAAALAAAAPDTATYTGEKASGVILASGYTKEVEQARKDFQKAFEDAAARKTSTPDAQTYTGPFASAEITDSGFTKEVEAARKEFLATFEKVAARSPASPEAHTPYKAPQATPSAPASHKGPQYTGPLASGTIAPSGFTIEVDEARKQFMKAYDAAAALAAKTPDYSAVTYAASAHTHVQGGAPQPVEPTPEVARATAEFMAAWNAAASRVATIESTLVKSTPAAQVSISLPTHEEALETLRQANEEFMAAWNAAAQRVSSVQQAVTTYGSPKPVQPTEDVKQATAEFMAAWQAAARRAPKIEQAVVKAASYSSGAPQQVQATKEVQKATAEFMAAWNAAAARVPKIETAMYSAAQPAATSVGGTKQFLTLFTSAEQNAVQPSGSLALVPIGVDVAFANTVGTSIAYAGTTASSPETVVTLKTFPLSNRLFAPIQGLPVFYDCKCN
ncbi:uncharacterized protein LOC143032630 [Oratosquilla oratoria]|uniref:uncharacterized protein LOC143032630 n=1 Tax=Oratosquilla oratoria TaxID=337810 RepID=UPI003F76A73D